MRAIDADELLERIPKPTEKDEKVSRNGCIADMVILVCDSPTVPQTVVHQNGANNIMMTNCGVLNL